MTRAPICDHCRASRHHRCDRIAIHGDTITRCTCPPAFHPEET